jgi:transcriptional regulator with XRE-family HTH domain
MTNPIQKMLTETGLTHEELAQRLGLSRPAVSNIAKARTVGEKTLRRYAEAMGYTVDVTVTVTPAQDSVNLESGLE